MGALTQVRIGLMLSARNISSNGPVNLASGFTPFVNDYQQILSHMSERNFRPQAFQPRSILDDSCLRSLLDRRVKRKLG